MITRVAPLTTERVIHAAIVFADETGLESLSMRRLGQELGVEAMSLYNHVANKNELLDGMVEAIAGQFSVPAVGNDWKRALRESALSARAVLLRHPWACGLTMARPNVGPARLRFAEAVLGCFRSAGFSPQLAHHALHAYDGHIFGFLMQELRRPALEELGPGVAAILRGERAEQYPHITESVLHTDHDDEYEFALILDLILDGLEGMR